MPGVGAGARYKFELETRDGSLRLKADPMARPAEVPPATASVVDRVARTSGATTTWMAPRREPRPAAATRCGSTRCTSARGGPGSATARRPSSWPTTSATSGFTHVELLPVAEHPFGGSWGYQVTGYYAPTARFGTPDDFRYFVDHLHRSGIGVIVDWVPAHFPKDDWALARFDGTALYEHADPRLGEHPDWGTLVFNYGRNEVRNFLIANALYWLEEFHIDGLRVDAVASMLYLDYSREPGEWVPNQLRRPREPRRHRVPPRAEHRRVRRAPRRDDDRRGVHVVADGEPARSTTAASASPTSGTWAGCTTRSATSSHDPVHRSFHHRDLTFGLLYAFTENFVLPLSHDEVVHGKGSLLDKMPGDEWQRFANLRALYGWMWAYPGGQLLFMGGEIAQWTEWSEERGVDWAALDGAMHRGVQELVRALNRVSAADAGHVGARPRAGRLPVARRRRRRAQRLRLPALVGRRSPGGGLPRQLHAGAARGLPRRACRGAASGGCCSTPTPVLRRHRLRRHPRRVGRRRRAPPGPAGLGLRHAAAAGVLWLGADALG